jgi:hypothetical protein
MKPNQTPEDDESLGRVLRQWSVDTPLPPRFQEQVWQRISRAEAQAAPTLWISLSQWLEVVLARPRFAFSYVAVLLAVGMVAGSLAAQARTSGLKSDLSLRYVQSVDPFRADFSRP